MPLIAPALALWRWLAGSRAGRIAAFVALAALAALGLRRAGYRAAERDRAAEDVAGVLDIRARGDEAFRRAEGDTRPVNDRLAEHGRLRDD